MQEVSEFVLFVNFCVPTILRWVAKIYFRMTISMDMNFLDSFVLNLKNGKFSFIIFPLSLCYYTCFAVLNFK